MYKERQWHLPLFRTKKIKNISLQLHCDYVDIEHERFPPLFGTRLSAPAFTQNRLNPTDVKDAPALGGLRWSIPIFHLPDDDDPW